MIYARDWMNTYRELQEKFDQGAEITEEDVKRAWELVSTVGREEHRLIYSKLKLLRQLQQEAKQPKQEPELMNVTNDDLLDAKKKAEENPTPENLAYYSKIKYQWQKQHVPELLEDEIPKVTLEDVEKAKEQAKLNPRPENLATYSKLKQWYERQQANDTQE